MGGIVVPRHNIMLRTGKQLWEAQAKLSALEIRKQELDFHIDRYSMLITQAAVEVAVTFMSLLHLRNLPDELVGSRDSITGPYLAPANTRAGGRRRKRPASRRPQRKKEVKA